MERTSLVRQNFVSTPMGEIAKALIKDGGKLGVSSRGMGSLENKGGANYVKDDFYLIVRQTSLQTLLLLTFR